MGKSKRITIGQYLVTEFKENWTVYTVIYSIFLVYSWGAIGVSNWTAFIPFRAVGVICAFIFGKFYIAYKNEKNVSALYKDVLFSLNSVILILLLFGVLKFLRILGFDISVFII